MLSRRKFLAAGVVTIAGLATIRYVRSSEESAIVSVLRKQLHYLDLDEEGMHSYARDLTSRKLVSRNRLRLIDVAGPLYADLVVPSGASLLMRSLRNGEERVISLYLLSSDFFINGADETKMVRYLRFYDPLDLHPCSNPFARPLLA